MSVFNDILSLICPLKPRYKLSAISGPDFWQKITFDCPFGLLDGKYYTTDYAGWCAVLPRLLTSQYAAELDDCEDIALATTLKASREYGLNAIGMAVGNMPQGRHGFCILYVADRGWMLFEPQRGFGFGGKPFAIGENGYTVDKILI